MISIPVLLFGALGNFHLYKEVGDWSFRNIIVLITAIGVELAILILLHTIAKSKASLNNIITGWLLAVVIPVSLLGQYSYLLKEASKKTEAVQMATGALDTLAGDKAALIASKVPLQGERAVMVTALDKELSTGYGSKSKAIQDEIAKIDTKLSDIDTKIAGLGIKVEGKQAESLEVTELSVLAKEFGLDANQFMKVMVAIFLTIANALGFWLVYLADIGKLSVVEVTNVSVVATPKRSRAKRNHALTKVKEPKVSWVVLSKDELPANVVMLPADMAG